MKKMAKDILRRIGFDIVRYRPNHQPKTLEDLANDEIRIVELVKPYTLTSEVRIAALISAVGYVSKRRIPGALAECGVWRGGSMMAVALTLMYHGDVNRDLYLYDTFDGMVEPTSHDKSFDGQSARSQLERDPAGTGIWCRSPIEDVRRNLLSTGYPEKRLHFVKGKVEETLPSIRPERLALLRLDTDWYESTRHELVHLFPLLDPRSPLIIDDYGHWQGARRAVDEYTVENELNLYLHRVDYTCRVAIRTP